MPSAGAVPSARALRGGEAPSTAEESYWRPLERILAVGVLVLLGLRFTLPLGLTAGYLLALALAPLWLHIALRYRQAPVIFVSGSVAAVMGVLLSMHSVVDHEFSRSSAAVSMMLLVGTLAGAGAILWARTLMRDGWIAAAFGVGILLGVSPSSPLFDENPWKFGFSVPVTIILLGLASLSRRRWFELAVLVAVIPAAALNDARSTFAILLVTLLATLWQTTLRSTSSRWTSGLKTMVAIGGMGYIVYSFGQALILDGYLGQSTQERSQRQIEASGNLLLGARPELGASLALITERPVGFGVGVTPSSSDIGVAKEGMAALGYDPDNNYVERYMFGQRFELHSIISDLWADFGIAGIVFGLVLLVVLITTFSQRVSTGRAPAILSFLVVQSLWNFLFSPFYGSDPNLILALGLLLLFRERKTPGVITRPGPSDVRLAPTRDRPAPLAAGDVHGRI